MPFVNRDEAEERLNREAAGGPPTFEDIEFDPNDPDTVKVHYDVSGWDFEQRAELSEVMAERSVPHMWEGDELVVPEEIEAAVDQIFDELEAELGPFQRVLTSDGTEFGLDEWPSEDRDKLKAALIEAGIEHRWEGSTVVVATDSEDIVDDLLDAIEAGDDASLDDEAPEGVLDTLFQLADQLQRQPTSPDARSRLLELYPRLAPGSPPFGLAVAAWRAVYQRTGELVDQFESGDGTPTDISDAADKLRDVTRLWV